MTFSIGRFGTDITLRNPSAIRRDGNKVTFSGWAKGTSTETLQALIQQMNGLAGNFDEPVVPVVYSYDTTFQGYYRIDSVGHELDPDHTKTFQFKYTISASLVAGGLSLPELETSAIGAARTSKPGGVTQQYWTAVPDDVLLWSIPTASITGPYVERTYNVGGDSIFYAQSNDLTAYSPTFCLAPDKYYSGSAYLKLGASRLYGVGRQITNYPAAWSLGNGLVTLGPANTSSYAFSMQCRKAAGGNPTVTTYDLEIGYITAGPVWNTMTLGAPVMLTSLRNSPEEQRIRLSWNPGTNAMYRFTLDIRLRRGARGVELRWGANGYSQSWGFAWRASGAFSSIDGNSRAIEEDAADADGNKRLLISQVAATLGPLGRVYAGAATEFSGFAGYTPQSPASGDTAVSQQDQYFAAMSEVQRVVEKS